ncbi:MAG TPA: CotH kinase family protein [Pirellulaceae bacterium]|nr:CotH kinase family protein [Pirellulaceae bacterium]
MRSASFSLMFVAMLSTLTGCQPAVSEPVPPAVARQRESTPAVAITPTSVVTSSLPVAVVAHAPALPDPSKDFFEQGKIPELRIRLNQQQEQKLRADQRRFVDCVLIEDGTTTYKKVAVKLKGAAGSFRNLDDRPAFTLKMKKKDERFHGMDKFHLNNSVQDESYMNELLASQICREAGYPATRVTHARVWLNDRDLGFYVFKEGFDSSFLARNFANPKGNLYDGGFCQDIDANMEKDEGDGVDDLSDVKAVVAACREGDQQKRWAMIPEKVDLDKFYTFVALELMMGHWDGYAQNRNNYRIYFRPEDNKAMFLLHGMDQMFQDPNYGTLHVPGALVANSILQNPEWQAKYRARVKELLPLFEAEKLHAKVDVAHQRIRPVVAKIHEDRARQLDDRVRDFKARLNDRQKNIRNQFPPEPIPFTSEGWALIEGWEAKPEGDTKLEKKEVEGRKVLSIETGPSNRSTASFRTKALLGRGSYKLEAKVKTINVTAIADDKGPGAGVRISGGNRTNQAAGNANWQTVSHPFEVADELREVDFVAELRSTSGTALFEVNSLRVVRVK